MSFKLQRASYNLHIANNNAHKALDCFHLDRFLTLAAIRWLVFDMEFWGYFGRDKLSLLQ